MAVDVKPLRIIYCARGAREDWKKLPYSRKKRPSQCAKVGQRYAQEISPGVWMCLCCSKRVKIVT